MRRHIDCDWLIKSENGVLKCCDVRGVMQGKEMSVKKALGEACEFFHSKNEKSSNDKHPIIINRKK